MKFNTPETGFVNSDQMLGGVGFKIKATAKTIRTLVDTLYRYKEEAVARELVSNCVDAHKLRDQKHRPSMSASLVQSVYANKHYFDNNKKLEWLAPLNKPINIHVPTENEPYFEAQDFGVGLPLDKILGQPLETEAYSQATDEEKTKFTPEQKYVFGPNGKVLFSGGMYTTLFDSPKDNDNSQIGGFGLGAKSPSTISDSYTVETRYNGEKYIIFIYEDSQRMPTAELITCDEIGLPKPIAMEKDEYNGMTVRVPVSIDRINKFTDALSKVMRFFDVPYVFTNKKVTVRQPNFVASFGKTKIAGNGTGRHYAVQGGVVYPIDINMLSYDISRLFQYLQRDTYTFFDIGQVNMQPSREDLEYDRYTISVLEDVLGETVNKVTEYLENYRIGSNIFEKIKNFERLKSIFNSEVLREYLPKKAVVEENVTLKPKEHILELLGTEYSSGYVNFGNSKQVTEHGYSDPKDWSLSKYSRYDIDTKYLYPQFRADGTPYKNYFVFMDGQGALKKGQELYSILQNQLSSFDKKECYFPYLTPINIDNSLIQLIMEKIHNVTLNNFIKQVEYSYYNGTLKKDLGYTIPPISSKDFHIDARELLISRRQGTPIEDQLPTDKEIEDLSVELFEKSVSKKIDAIGQDIYNKTMWSRDTSFKVYEFLRSYFDSLGAELYHVDSITVKPEEITLDKIRKLKGITVIRHGKWAPLSGECLMDWIKKAQEENKQIPFVFLRGHEVHEDSNLDKSINSPHNISFEKNGLLKYSDEPDLIKSSYSDQVIGVRIVGRKFFEEHKDVFVPLREMLDTGISFGVSSLVELRLNEIKREIYDCMPSKNGLICNFNFMTYANLLVPGSFTELELSYHKQCFKPKFDKFKPGYRNSENKAGRYLSSVVEQMDVIKNIKKHYKRISKFWDGYNTIFEPFTKRFGVHPESNFNWEAIDKITKQLEYEEVYRRANLKPHDFEKELKRKWFIEGSYVVSERHIKENFARYIRDYGQTGCGDKTFNVSLHSMENLLEKYFEIDDLRDFYMDTVLAANDEQPKQIYEHIRKLLVAVYNTDDEI